ncbi:hypothetical protein LCGC14_1532230 [marine sediment metagenome]|uniref:Uncharacterized protein n=1 Tax=marine sediment metagenome TaxID=412755 RepID=A0A0F9IVK2_9ZZZZ
MSSMDSKPKEELKRKNNQSTKREITAKTPREEIKIPSSSIPQENIEEDLLTLHKIHSILLNCINLSKKDKLEFCNSQRYFMKLYLKKLRDQLEKE